MIRAFAVVSTDGDHEHVVVYTRLVDAENCAKEWRESSPDGSVTIRELVEARVLRIMSRPCSHPSTGPSPCATCVYHKHGRAVCSACTEDGGYDAYKPIGVIPEKEAP